MKHPLGPTLLVALALLVGSLFVGSNLYYNRAEELSLDNNLTLSAPLDDTFIHLQYARQFAQGQWLSYNDGDRPSSGASSLLYVLVLGGAHLVGFSGHKLLAFAIILGAGFLVLCALLGYRLTLRLAGERRAGLWSGALIATNGAFVWGATSGMEVALVSVLILATLVAFERELSTRRFVLTPLVGALCALSRPEGLLFGVIITAGVVFELLREELTKSPRQSSRGKTMAMVLYALLPLGVGVGQYIFYRIATGSTLQNGVVAKSLLYEPIFYPTEFVDAVFQNLTKLSLMVLTGLEPGNYLFPGTILFCMLGIWQLAIKDRRHRTFALASGTALLLAMSSIATLGTWGWHHYRYLLPFFPPVLVLAVVGFYSLRTLQAKSWLPEALAGFALVCSLVGLPVWAATTGGNSLQINEQQISIAYWIRENLPPGARVGINDAGAIRYYGAHPTVDLIGLTTNGLALPTRNGVGSLYEALENMPEEKRPDYFAIYPTWFPGFEGSGLLDQEIARFSLSSRPEVAGIVGGSEVVVSRAEWSLAQSGHTFRGQGSLKDSLDVADLASEKEHDYHIEMPLIGLEPANLLRRERSPEGELVVDGGRGVQGAEQFTIRGLSPKRPVEVLMRTTSEPFALQVQADGEDLGQWIFQPSASSSSSSSGWQEATFRIPAEQVRSGSLRVRLSAPQQAPLETHTAYHYWFVQRG
jgi:hypothetical protein